MALGGQSRFYWPYPNPQNFDEVRANFDHAQERFDRMPVFAPQYTGALTATITTSGAYEALGQPFTFYKDESWTVMEYTAFLQGFYNASGAGGVTMDVRTVVDGVVVGIIAQHHWNLAGLQRAAVAGVQSQAGLKAGRHVIQMQARSNSASSVLFDFGTSVTRILECIPPRGQ
jgi:hypothetical protein